MALTRRSFIVGSAIATLLAHSRAAVSQALEGTVAVTGGNVVWRRFGDGPKAPLLLIHGGPGAPSDYLEPFAALGDERAVFVWDQLGCGRSARPSDSSLWTLERFVAELDAVRKTLAPGPVHVLGHSWGSMLAIEWLATARPAAVESVIFAGPCLSVPRYVEDVTDLVATLTPESRAAIAEADRTGDYGSAAYQKAMNEDWAPRYLARSAGPNNDFLNRTFAGFGAETYEFMWGPSEFKCTGTLKNFDRTAALPALRVPVLFHAGEFDETCPETAREHAAMTPGAEVAVISGAAHMTMLDAPDAAIGAVREFLTRVEA